MKLILYFTLIGLLLFTIYGSLNLSIAEFRNKDVCPKVIGIPACYIVLVFFALVLAAHLFGKNKFWYYILIAVPFLLALGGTLSEFSGKIVCPRTPGGTPMCFISLGMCVLLILLKTFEVTR